MYEEAVMWYVCAGNQRFVCPQYWVRKEEKDWSCPDFVALDILESRVFIVEVTTGTDLKPLANKIINKNEQWIDFTINKLPEPFRKWDSHVVAFVRSEDFVQVLRRLVNNQIEFSAFSLENIIHNWKWEWDKLKNLPVNPLINNPITKAC